MNINDPFSILGISPLSTPEEIKKSFRMLIYTYHPDTAEKSYDTDQVSKVISAYKKALQISREKRETLYRNFENQFYRTFFFPYIKPDSPGTFLDNLNILLSSMENILYSREKYPFFSDYIEILLLELDKCAESSIKNYLVSLFNGFRFLITSRIESLSLQDNSSEYDCERSRSVCIEYFSAIFLDRNYLRIRNHIFSQKELITGNIARSLTKIPSLVYKRELFSLMMIIILFSEEDFFEQWFELLPAES